MQDRPTLLMSVDFEDWHQLVRRRFGVADWAQPGPALERQTDALLGLFDELGVKATFFILGITARAYPNLVRAVAESGHEIGCHGDEHLPVHTQTPEEFAADLQAARTTIEQLTGIAPLGYRAPLFSITRDSPWAYDVLADQGFAYDASQHDSPRIRRRARPATGAPHSLSDSLWEFPAAVWQTPVGPVPVGGASYWAQLPRRVVIRGLRNAGPMAGLYLHPQEVDPEPLSSGVAGLHVAIRTARRNVARRRTPPTLRAIANRFKLIPYGEAYASISAGARPEPIQGQGSGIR